MFGMLKKLFTNEVPVDNEEDAPGRTFKKIHMGRYFGLKDDNVNKSFHDEAKKKKIERIEELALEPKFLRYIYPKNVQDLTNIKPISAYVAFQKEDAPKNWNMIHIMEISFIVKSDDFNEFERMAHVSLEKDFRHLEPEGSRDIYQGQERRKQEREEQDVA